MIRAVFFDIDGTILPEGAEEIPAGTITALHCLHAEGIRIFIASGRPPAHLFQLPSQLLQQPWDGFLLFNGQYCTERDLKPFFKRPLPSASMKLLADWLKQNKVPSVFFEEDYSYLAGPQNSSIPHAFIHEASRQETIERCLKNDTYQVCPCMAPERDEDLMHSVPGIKAVRWSPAFADIIPADGGKAEGMKKMLEHFGLHKEECMAFGDGGNDSTMLEYAGIGVAMGNAMTHVKEIADYTTADCQSDGILNALIHFEIISKRNKA